MFDAVCRVRVVATGGELNKGKIKENLSWMFCETDKTKCYVLDCAFSRWDITTMVVLFNVLDSDCNTEVFFDWINPTVCSLKNAFSEFK